MKKIWNASKAIADIKNLSGVVRHGTPFATNQLRNALNTVDITSPIIAQLKTFNHVANAIADIHPYAKAVLSIFTCASKMIIDQEDRDNAVQDLLKKLSEVYAFMNEDKRLAEIPTMQELYGKVARQTLECADFIVHYSETKSAWLRLAKDVFKETDVLIQKYSAAFDTLMQQFRDGAVRGVVVNVYRFAEDMDFKDMVYAEGAGRQTYKRCLPGTRGSILSEIKTWIDSTGDDVQRIFWLNGTAGKGKSAIAHTVADWFIERGGPGAFFCFDRSREADRRHEKIFTTIARDLVDGDPIIRRALASVVHDNNELRHTTEILRQWREFILGPVTAAAEAVTAPVLIVIDALDESGDKGSREQILRMLGGRYDTDSPNHLKLPANIRVLVTSRPLDDIYKYLHDASQVRTVSMDDIIHVSIESSERDIHRYISTQLEGIEGFNDGHFKKLTMKSDGLFEWARLACEYISGTNMVGQAPYRRFEAVLAGKSEQGVRLLDKMYGHILEDIMPEDVRAEAIPIFCSVMAQILVSMEPLPCTALTAMRYYFPSISDHCNVEQVICSLGPLLTGTLDSHIPVRPLHASFYNFLTDKSRSKMFFVDVSLAQRDLSFASLGVMKDSLRFNICRLESSYLPNSAVPDLEKRMKESISTELSYSCRFWGTHVVATPIEPLLVKEVKAFFDNVQLLFWLEVVALLRVLGGAVATLSRVADWLVDHPKSQYADVIEAVKDTRRFLRTFAPAILHSTPHLYLSALPFAPTGSTISRAFAASFPRAPRVVAGHTAYWPLIEKTIFVCSRVSSVAISPDGKRIVCGSGDGTIHIRDMETGEILGDHLVGHTAGIWSIAISPNGHRIVSGSADKTLRIWDANTGMALSVRLHGHVDEVNSVSISPNGNRIVSGSGDMTIRVWNMETGEELGAPLKGHTSSVLSVAISPDGNRIVSGSYDKTIRIWDMHTGRALGEPLRGHIACIHRIAISPHGNYIVSCSLDHTIRMWNAATGKASGVPLQGHHDKIRAVAIFPDGNLIASGSADSTIRIWDAQTRQPLDMPLYGHTGSVLCVAVSPDGCRIVSTSTDNTIRVWSVDGRKASTTAPLRRRNVGQIWSVAISPDGKRIVSASDDNTIRVWDAYTGKALVAPLQGHTDAIRSVAISPNGSLIVSGSSDKTIRVWDTITGKALCTPLRGHTDQVLTVAISPDGTRIVSGSADKTIRVWDALTGNAMGTPLQGHTDWVWSVAISPDGNMVVSGSSDETIRVWNAINHKALGAPLQGRIGAIRSVAISPDGKHIVSASVNKTICLWDVATREAFGVPFQGHTGRVFSVVIALNGNVIVSGSSDKTIRVWNAMTGEALGAPLQGHIDGVRSIAVSRDGKRIVSGSNDATIRVWDLECFTRYQSFKSPAICFSSSPVHALCSPSSFLQEFRTTHPLVPNEDGWVIGSDGQLLLWVPASLYPLVYVPNILVTSRDALEVDLSRFAHGTSWQKCREMK